MIKSLTSVSPGTYFSLACTDGKQREWKSCYPETTDSSPQWSWLACHKIPRLALSQNPPLVSTTSLLAFHDNHTFFQTRTRLAHPRWLVPCASLWRRLRLFCSLRE